MHLSISAYIFTMFQLDSLHISVYIQKFNQLKCDESFMKVYLVNCFESIFFFFESLPVHVSVLIVQL